MKFRRFKLYAQLPKLDRLCGLVVTDPEVQGSMENVEKQWVSNGVHAAS
jgi:hypothetical protein